MELILLKVITGKDVWFATIGFSIKGSISIFHMLYLSRFDNVNKSDIPFITVKNADYRCIIHNISKSKTINSLKNSVLKDGVYI